MKFAVFLLLLLNLFCTSLSQNQATIKIDDPAHYHAHDTSFNITVVVTYTGTDFVYWQWVNLHSKPITNPVAIRSGVNTTISSPSRDVGYYGLYFTSPSVILPDRVKGEPREYGFVIMTPRGRVPDPDSYFGTVHSDWSDLYLPTGTKTIWWAGQNADYWKYLMEQYPTCGKYELGIFASKSTTGVNWDTQPDDNSRISSEQLQAIQSLSAQYFSAYSNGQNQNEAQVELGLEENIGSRFGQKYYIQNLADKAAAVRAGAKEANANVKLVYQIVGTSATNPALKDFILGVAGPHFDVLSLHTYDWPDFRSPEEWLDSLMNETFSLMKQANHIIPVWFTETGIPVNDPPVPNFEDGGHLLPGSTRGRAASYMAKLHVLAIHAGVQRIYWYQYADGWFDRSDAEANFGMRDFFGYALPGYVTMWNLQNKLDGKKPVDKIVISNNVLCYVFNGSGEQVFVLWTYPENTNNIVIPLDSIQKGLNPSKMKGYSLVGSSFSVGNSIDVSSDPLFLINPL
eukprot:TRINITY_DN4061_c0_g1_i1.p1 TRINITY_DN4061_c0_g1~~TRINITY_DN4061_c0_g1_i1.p1  ORF type:complete len:513 (-),score=83.34 TRINITY_DN4061_c0_g1_i1:45-1583(-)